MGVQAPCRMWCWRCTLDIRGKPSAGSEMNESDNMKQTQKDTFLVLFPCGSTNHTEKKPVRPWTVGAISPTVSGCRPSWAPYPHLHPFRGHRLLTTRTASSPAAGAPSPHAISNYKRLRLRPPPPSLPGLPSWPWSRSETPALLSTYLWFTFPNVSFPNEDNSLSLYSELIPQRLAQHPGSWGDVQKASE